MCDVNETMLINDNKWCHLIEGDETQDMQDILYQKDMVTRTLCRILDSRVPKTDTYHDMFLV